MDRRQWHTQTTPPMGTAVARADGAAAGVRGLVRPFHGQDRWSFWTGTNSLPVLNYLPSFGVTHTLTRCFASARRQGEGNIDQNEAESMMPMSAAQHHGARQLSSTATKADTFCRCLLAYLALDYPVRCVAISTPQHDTVPIVFAERCAADHLHTLRLQVAQMFRAFNFATTLLQTLLPGSAPKIP